MEKETASSWLKTEAERLRFKASQFEKLAKAVEHMPEEDETFIYKLCQGWKEKL